MSKVPIARMQAILAGYITASQVLISGLMTALFRWRVRTQMLTQDGLVGVNIRAFFTCSGVMELGNVLSDQTGWPMASGEINTRRLLNHSRVSTTK